MASRVICQVGVLVHYISDTSLFFRGRRDRPLGLSASDRSEDLSLHLLAIATGIKIPIAIGALGMKDAYLIAGTSQSQLPTTGVQELSPHLNDLSPAFQVPLPS